MIARPASWRRAAVAFIFVTIVLDVVAFGVAIPVVPKLVEHAKRGDTFVAVGAAHIVGKDGLLELLEKEGFKAERAQ